MVLFIAPIPSVSQYITYIMFLEIFHGAMITEQTQMRNYIS